MRARLSLRGFSLIELVVVIAIIALLLGMLLPSLRGAQQQAHRALCASRLRQWGVALQMYRQDYDDFIPTEGHLGLGIPYVPNSAGHGKRGTWYNELPQYLDVPRYRDLEGVNWSIAELPDVHVWICPAKNRTESRISASGKNRFHFAMNQVLDGTGSGDYGGPTTPGFPDMGDKPLRASRFAGKVTTVYMFDVIPNSPSAAPINVATQFHGDFANVLYLGGGVAGFRQEDFLTDTKYGIPASRWRHPHLYWGYLPPPANQRPR